MNAPDVNKFTYIAHVVPGMKNVNVNFIVLEIGVPRVTNQGYNVRTVKVADPTGSINMGIWNELGEFLCPGDIYRLRNGFTNVYKGCLTLSCGKMGELHKTGEFFMAYVEMPNMSEFSAELAQKYPTVSKRGSPDDEPSSSGGGGGTGPNGRSGGPPPKRPGNGHGGSAAFQSSGGKPAATTFARQAAGGGPAWRSGDDGQPMAKVARRDDHGGADQRLRPSGVDGSWQRLSRQSVPLNVALSPHH